MRKNKKWLSIILMVFIVLAAGCEVQSDDMKKDIIMQDERVPDTADYSAFLKKYGWWTAGIKQIILLCRFHLS